jgi:chemotaxis protein MotB
MRRRRRHPAHSNRERWLVSYADFITLLFAFFVVLYSSSQVDKRKVGMLSAAIQSAFQQMGVFKGTAGQAATASTGGVIASGSGEGPDANQGDLAVLKTELEALLAPEINRKEIALTANADGLVISLREAGFFESGSARIKPASETAFDSIASLLRRRDYRLRVDGHTDTIPIHTAQFPSNWELSTSRATEIVRLLIVREGFSPERLSAAGYAGYHPVASNLTAEGRGMNRRVDIVVIGGSANDTHSAPAGAGSPPDPVLPGEKKVEPVPPTEPASDPPTATPPPASQPPLQL